jgi:hypothetical protein
MTTAPVKASRLLDQFIQLRLAVGYLGQRKQHHWWDCDLLDQTGIRFLQTTFPRTAVAAGYRATTEAACRVHDQSLGRMGRYHLFRLPPEIEDQVELCAGRIDWEALLHLIGSPDSALACLRELADARITAPEGPVQIGVVSKLLTPVAIQELAAHYDSAFAGGIRCFPYFAPEKDGR